MVYQLILIKIIIFKVSVENVNLAAILPGAKILGDVIDVRLLLLLLILFQIYNTFKNYYNWNYQILKNFGTIHAKC